MNGKDSAGSESIPIETLLDGADLLRTKNLTATAPASATELSTSFHTYAIEWDPGQVRFLLDDVLYATQTTAALRQVAPTGVWEFDHPFFILLNVAVGGTFPGSPGATTTFPQTMKVDWVRVYERSG